MKERPILFAPKFAQAAHTGGKTQTRRVVGMMPASIVGYRRQICHSGGLTDSERARLIRDGSPYGKPGDRLWVREAFLPDPPRNGEWDDKCGEFTLEDIPEEYRSPRHVLYRATWDGGELRWRPSIHMPRWASRTSLELTAVRVERLQEITEAGACAEGIGWFGPHYGHPRELFWAEWDRLNARRGFGWEANPWVWALEFRRLEL